MSFLVNAEQNHQDEGWEKQSDNYTYNDDSAKETLTCEGKENCDSNSNERKSEQAHISHAPTLLENAVYNEWQFQALVTGNRTKKGI